MLRMQVQDLLPGDRIAFSDSTRRSYTLKARHATDDPDLCTLVLDSRPDMVVPVEMEVRVTTAMRKVIVPCLGHTVLLLWNTASGPAPIRVLCGECDEKTTAEIVAYMKKKEEG